MSDMKVTTPNDRDIVVSRFFAAPPALVFDAHTKPELVRRWQSGPDGWDWVVCDIDLTVGGAYHYRWRNADGREIGFRGVYLEISRPDFYVHSERFEGGGTRMTYTMRASSKDARDAMLKTGMTGGMEIGYARLDATLASVA